MWRIKKNKLRRIWLLLLTLMVCILSWSSAVNAAPKFDLELKTLDQQPTNLRDYIGQGQWVLVMFWASDCAICMKQEEAISTFHNAHKSKDAVVIGVAIDGYGRIGEIKNYLNRLKPSFDTLIGEIAIVANQYQLATSEAFFGTPTYLLFNRQGELVGNNPGILRISALEKFIQSH